MRALFDRYEFPYRPESGTAYVYRIFDRESGVLLYVGCTNNPRRRLREHHDLHRYRFDDVRYEVDPRQPEVKALQVERAQIRTLAPRDNDRMASR